MSKYFEEVEFEMPDNPGEQARAPKVTFNREMVKEAVAAIRAEIEGIRSGDSELTTYAVNPGSFGFPAANRLTMFVEQPNETNYKAFIEISKQDFGIRAAMRFVELLKASKGVTNG